MEFRLIYEGPLKAASAQAAMKEKHWIRKELHKQLSTLWKVQRPLTELAIPMTVPVNPATGETRQTSDLEDLAYKYARCGFRFVPLVNKPLGLVCSLDILFLRRENPGELIRHGGAL